MTDVDEKREAQSRMRAEFLQRNEANVRSAIQAAIANGAPLEEIVHHIANSSIAANCAALNPRRPPSAPPCTTDNTLAFPGRCAT